MMTGQSPQAALGQVSIRPPRPCDPHLVDLGHPKWDPNAPPSNFVLPDWYGWMTDPWRRPGQPVALVDPGRSPADRGPLLFLDRGSQGHLASPETVEIFNFCWDRIIDSYRDPIYSVGSDRREG